MKRSKKKKRREIDEEGCETFLCVRLKIENDYDDDDGEKKNWGTEFKNRMKLS